MNKELDQNKKKYLSGWQDEFTLEDMKKWCGDYKNPWKTRIRKHIQDCKYESVLDVGAGVCSEYYGFKHDGYDISYNATDITPMYIDYSLSRGINIVLANMEALPFSDDEFDCCICLDVMNHQLEYEKAIKEMLRVAKKSVIITFFKPFEEEAIFGQQRYNQIVPFGAHTSGRYKVEKSLTGVIEHRVLNNSGDTVCIYNFFNRSRFIDFLNSLAVKYVFEVQPENSGKTTLFLEKDASGEINV